MWQLRFEDGSTQELSPELAMSKFLEMENCWKISFSCAESRYRIVKENGKIIYTMWDSKVGNYVSVL